MLLLSFAPPAQNLLYDLGGTLTQSISDLQICSLVLCASFLCVFKNGTFSLKKNIKKKLYYLCIFKKNSESLTCKLNHMLKKVEVSSELLK